MTSSEKEIDPFLPGLSETNLRSTEDKDGADQILDLTIRSQSILKTHPVNFPGRERGEDPETRSGSGARDGLRRWSRCKERFGIEGFVISAVHLLKGIGVCAGLEVIEVPGATGYFDTNYEGKAPMRWQAEKEGFWLCSCGGAGRGRPHGRPSAQDRGHRGFR